MRMSLVALLASTAFFLTACSIAPQGTTPSGPPATAARSLASDPSVPVVYVSDDANNLVAVFNRTGTQIGTLTDRLNYPQGLFVDRQHDLWVANRGGSNVLEFARGATAPTTTLHDDGSQPEDVTICPDGTIYVANIIVSGGGDVAAYAPGARRPTRKLNYEGGNFFFLACDAAGNVFGTLVLGTSGTVVEFPRGRQKNAVRLPIFMGGNPGGIAVNAADNLLVDDPTGTVTEYTESGTQTGVVLDTNGSWNGIALERKGDVILGADPQTRDAVAVTFPGGLHRQTYKSHDLKNPIAVAIDPP